MRSFSYATLAVLSTGAGYSQAPEPRPAFEVADVNPVPFRIARFAREGVLRGTRYEIKSATLVDRIASAYRVDTDKVLGGPPWLELDRFDILAKTLASTSRDSLKPMLQSLLADRFGLVAQMQSEPLPAYALKVGKHLPIKPSEGSKEPGCRQSLQMPPGAAAGDGPVALSSLMMTLSAPDVVVEHIEPKRGSGEYNVPARRYTIV